MIAADRVVSLAKQWGLSARRVEYPTSGTMNEIAVISTEDGGRFVLRGHRHRDRGRVDFEHAVMGFARSAGIPVPGALAAADGGVVVEEPDGYFSCFEHAVGRQVGRDELDERHSYAMGRTLAKLHNALACFPTSGAPRASGSGSYWATLERIDELLAHLRSLNDPGDQERWAIERLESRAAWLADRPDPQIATPADEQVLHGDYHQSNVFFDNHGEVSAVIDWDKAEVRSRAEEVIRAMHLSLWLDPARCVAFLHGYRQVAALPHGRLQQAAVSYGHQRACGLWLYETVYLGHDDRPRRFLTPGRFVPFINQWEPLRAALAADG